VESGARELFSVFIIFVLLLISRGFRLRECFLPPRPHSHLSGTPKPPFFVGMINLSPRHILRQGDPPRGVARVPKILHTNVCVLGE
jgi:hypothetical protein